MVARIDLDPYRRSFLNVSTHVLAPALTEEALRAALRAGHAYVSHDWMGDPTGFQFTMTVHGLETTVPMGAEVTFVAGATFEVESPLPCHIRLLKAGLTVAEGRGPHWESRVSGPGVYRAEAWLVVDGEERPWVYSNPIYVR